MCGIAGKVYADPQRPVGESLLRSMCRAIAHRGPDDEGIYRQGPVGLGMRRLKVIDLEGGHQPMSNEAQSLWIVFNGEIYNYRQLRRELEEQGQVFRTHSDTETILHLYEREGVHCLRHLRGMFAFALWDLRTQTLMLARDRLGKKPLFYALMKEGISFASELGALLCDPQVDRSIDRQAIDEYLSFLFIPQPRTIYEQVKKLPPASYGLYQDGQFQIHPYWEVRYDQVRVRREEESVEELDLLLRQAVEMRMLADVPVGAFLSGGLDSSLVVALMQKVGGQQVRTYSVGFRESSFNELDHARKVAQFLGTQHQEYVVDYQVQELLPGLLDHFGEPFADSSAIPTYHLSKVTRQEVTVALSGDGGDEVFGGYRRYLARRWADAFNRWPAWGGRGAVEWLGRALNEPATYYGRSFRKKFKRFLEFSAALREAPSTSWGFFFTQEEKRYLYGENIADILTSEFASMRLKYEQAQARAPGQEMLWLDLVTYLPDDILVKVDRMSMACSLEVRSPLLDHQVVEFAARLPRDHKYTLTQGKRLLRRLAGRYLPSAILQRPKQGFAVPLASWLQKELRPWMEEILLSKSCRQRGFFVPSRLQQMMSEHLKGQRDYSQQLWAMLVLELWLQREAR